ncbi:hypothetical protein [Thiolapillus sp.]|uniref:hypothetical protein n=1 Tax=Thiolapillus sp. TaxID=2017437 RepID=UPI0035ABFEA8
MTRTAGAPIGCQRPSRFWGLGCPKIYHEAEDTLVGVEVYWIYDLYILAHTDLFERKADVLKPSAKILTAMSCYKNQAFLGVQERELC